MKLLKWVFDFYLDASIHVAVAVYCLIRVTALIFGISLDQHFLYVAFFGSITCYNFIKYGVEAKKYFLITNQYHKGIQVFSIISLAIAGYHIFFLSAKVWFGILCLLILSGLYAIPISPRSKNLRSWGGLKIFVVAVVWSGVTVFLPVLCAKAQFSFDVYIEAIQRVLLILILIVPFEIRDLIYDESELRTLPQRIGVANTKFFGATAVMLFYFSTFFKDNISIREVLLKGTLFLVLGVVTFITRRKQPKYFASFWVESIPIFWWVFALILYR